MAIDFGRHRSTSVSCLPPFRPELNSALDAPTVKLTIITRIYLYYKARVFVVERAIILDTESRVIDGR